MANACKTSPGRSLSAPLAVDWADAGHCLVVAPTSDSCSSRADFEVFGVPVSLAGADLANLLVLPVHVAGSRLMMVRQRRVRNTARYLYR